LPETENAALNIAEHLHAAVEQEPSDIGNNRTIHVTISIRLVSWPAQANRPDKLVVVENTAMYAAKQAGATTCAAMNRVCACRAIEVLAWE